MLSSRTPGLENRAPYKEGKEKKYFHSFFLFFFATMLRTSETAKSMCGLFFDQRPDNGAINLLSYDVKEILNKRLDGKGPF
jgi:hypothetical protein